MTAADLHHRLAGAGLTVRVNGGNLLVSPKAKLTDFLAHCIRENKGGLLAYLEPPDRIEWLFMSGEVVESTRPANWFQPSACLSWRVPPSLAWHAMIRLPPAWGLAEPHDPAFDPFAKARITKVGTCYNCGGVDFWESRWGVRRCRRCVPPAAGAERRLKDANHGNQN